MKACAYSIIVLSILAAATFAMAGDDDSSDFRDPFWPVGFEPKKEAPPPPKVTEKPVAAEKPAAPPPKPVAQPDWPGALHCLKISGFAESNGSRSCVINGKTVSEGEKIAIAFNGFRYTWRVDRIAAQKSQMRFTRMAVATLSKD